MLKPDFFLSMIDENLSLQTIMLGIVNDLKKISQMKNLIETEKGIPEFLVTMIFVIALLVVVTLIMKILGLTCYKKYGDKINKALDWLQDKWIWNNTNRWFITSYLFWCFYNKRMMLYQDVPAI